MKRLVTADATGLLCGLDGDVVAAVMDEAESTAMYLALQVAVLAVEPAPA